jgi:hypothetical protein
MFACHDMGSHLSETQVAKIIASADAKAGVLCSQYCSHSTGII